jgi:serine/threonine protein kinase
MPVVVDLDLTQQENADYIQLLIKQHSFADVFFAQPRAYSVDQNDEQTLFILQQTAIPFRKPPETRKPEKRELNYQYYLVVKEKLLGEGAFGKVREILGVWKVGHGEIFFKKKPTQEKKRVLKSIFFEPAINAAIEERRERVGRVTPTEEEIIRETIKKKLYKQLKHEQKITRCIPHMGAKYDVIYTEDGVHLLQKMQPGADLSKWLTWLEQRPQGLSLIQRLLLCINLYERLDMQVHSSTIETAPGIKEPIVHRDLKPANICVKAHGLTLNSATIDFGFGNYRNYHSQKRVGTLIYMEPQFLHEQDCIARFSDDLFALAMICAEILGDKKRRKLKTVEELEKENENIVFENLCSKIPDCSEEQQEELAKIIKKCSRIERRQRYSKQEVLAAYKKLLLKAYRQIQTSNAGLQERIQSLQAQLNDYQTLSEPERQFLDQELTAADFLINHAHEFSESSFKLPLSLLTIWTGYCSAQINELQNAIIPSDTPECLLAHIQYLRDLCYNPILPNSYMLRTILAEWEIIKNLSTTFQELKFINADTLNLLFNNGFTNTRDHLVEIERLIKEEIQQLLEATLLTKNIPEEVKHRFIDLCDEASDIVSLRAFKEEIKSAINIEQLNAYYPNLCYVKSKKLETLLTPAKSMESVFNTMLNYYKEQIRQQWEEPLQLYQQSQSLMFCSSPWSKNGHRQKAIDALFEGLDKLCEDPDLCVATLPQQISKLLQKTIKEVNEEQAQGYGGHMGLTVSTLAKIITTLLQRFEKEHNRDNEGVYLFTL